MIDSKGGVVVTPEVVEPDVVAETPAGVEEAAPAASDDDATLVAEVADEAPVAESEPDRSEASDDAASEPAE